MIHVAKERLSFTFYGLGTKFAHCFELLSIRDMATHTHWMFPQFCRRLGGQHRSLHVYNFVIDFITAVFFGIERATYKDFSYCIPLIINRKCLYPFCSMQRNFHEGSSIFKTKQIITSNKVNLEKLIVA